MVTQKRWRPEVIETPNVLPEWPRRRLRGQRVLLRGGGGNDGRVADHIGQRRRRRRRGGPRRRVKPEVAMLLRLMGKSPLRETGPASRETRATFRETVRVGRHSAVLRRRRAGDDVGDRVDLVAGYAGQDGAVIEAG